MRRFSFSTFAPALVVFAACAAVPALACDGEKAAAERAAAITRAQAESQPMPSLPDQQPTPAPETTTPSPARPDATGEASAEPQKPEPTLDDLFAELKRQRDPSAARRIAGEIDARWRRSGSATVDVLMQWADKAANEKKYGTALDLYDQVTVLAPDFAEGWNRRATLHFLMDHYAKSMADINRVLALEPRQFGALSGMAQIFEATGRDQLALDALEKVIEIYPADRNAQQKIGELADKLAGSNI